MITSTVLVLFCAAVIGALIAWVVRGLRSKATEASMSARLDAALQNETRLIGEISSTEATHAAMVDRFQAEFATRAAAETMAATIPGLEAQITRLVTARDATQVELLRLSTLAAETAQNLKSTTQRLEETSNRAAASEERAVSLGEQFRQASERKATLESETSRIPELEQRLLASQQAAESLNGELTAVKELHGRTESALDADRDTLKEVRAEFKQLREQLEAAQVTINQLTADKADLATRLDAERTQSQAQIQLLNEARQSFSDNFKALSNDALKSNNQAFIDLAKSTLERFQEGARGDLDARQKAVDQLVKPIAESLQKVDGKLGEIEKARISSYVALTEQVKGLVETHIPSLRSETANLVKALRQPAIRGRWGELQLKRVVEMAGMLEHCDFIEQETRIGEEGRVRPDLIVKLPGGRNIVVDAKTPFTAYLAANETIDEAAQKLHMTQHAQQVRDHMTALGRKAYWEQFSPTPELVVMFIPAESFFSAALQEDPSLIEYGVNEKVVAATPTTLIALLRAVAYGWRQEKLAQNAEEISKLGKELYERISKVGEYWGDVGDRLKRAVEAYNKSTVSLETRVMVSARRFRDLKAGADDSEIAVLNQIETVPRSLQAEDLLLKQLSLDSATDCSANDVEVPATGLSPTGTNGD